jgi:hypothetical protein
MKFGMNQSNAPARESKPVVFLICADDLFNPIEPLRCLFAYRLQEQL